MSISRREFISGLMAAGIYSLNSSCGTGAQNKKWKNNYQPFPSSEAYYDVPPFGNVSLLHITDCHGQLLPVYFREPTVNIGVGMAKSKPPHLVGEHFMAQYGIKRGTPEAYAFTHFDFVESAEIYGKMGGFAHLKTLVDLLKQQRPQALLLDGGDTWQGSATALWTDAQDMVDASKLLGVDVMTGHWEFTYGAQRVKKIVDVDFKDRIEFVAQNIVDSEFEEPVFKPYIMREQNGILIAIIGQAFPYTPIANPRHKIPQWRFGIREDRLIAMVEEVRGKGAQLVVLLSHNGMDVDIKMASRVTGINVILGGHTHDAVPRPLMVKNPLGQTLVINSGSAGKFLSVLDLELKNKRIKRFQYNLLPVFSNLLKPDREMQALIQNVRKPYESRLSEKLAISKGLLFRRGTFNGSFDQLILDAMLAVNDADIAFSPGFRWGMNVLPGQAITFEDVMTQTAITYPQVTVNHFTGERIKEILEDVADNIFNADPYYQQGGDMVRVGGLQYAITPEEKMGQRISAMTLHGKPLMANKKYKVAGWASTAENLSGTPIWDQVAGYLRHHREVSITDLNVPKIYGQTNNKGMS